jgi:hypothetical protein
MKKNIRRMSIEPDDHGGHTVEVQFKETPTHTKGQGMSMGYHEPERKVFGKGQHKEMLAHVHTSLNLSADKPAGEKEREKDILDDPDQ